MSVPALNLNYPRQDHQAGPNQNSQRSYNSRQNNQPPASTHAVLEHQRSQPPSSQNYAQGTADLLSDPREAPAVVEHEVPDDRHGWEGFFCPEKLQGEDGCCHTLICVLILDALSYNWGLTFVSAVLSSLSKWYLWANVPLALGLVFSLFCLYIACCSSIDDTQKFNILHAYSKVRAIFTGMLIIAAVLALWGFIQMNSEMKLREQNSGNPGGYQYKAHIYGQLAVQIIINGLYFGLTQVRWVRRIKLRYNPNRYRNLRPLEMRTPEIRVY